MTSQIEYVKSAWCNLHRHAGRRREQIFLRWTPRPKVPSLSLSKSESWMKVTYLYLALILANFRVLMARGGGETKLFQTPTLFHPLSLFTSTHHLTDGRFVQISTASRRQLSHSHPHFFLPLYFLAWTARQLVPVTFNSWPHYWSICKDRNAQLILT